MLRSFRSPSLLSKDIGIILISVLVAVLLVRTGLLHDALASAREWKFLGSFIAGMFFTSAFTTAPAIAGLGELSLSQPIWLIGLCGALGAVFGDLVIFHFIRDRFGEHLKSMLRMPRKRSRLRAILSGKWFRWLTFLAGGLIIASPLPDELGIGMLGLSKASLRLFIPVSFGLNFIGICLIGLAARALAG